MFSLTQSAVDTADMLLAPHSATAFLIAKTVAYGAFAGSAALASWIKAVRPAYRASRDFLLSVTSAVQLVEKELRPNGGGSLRDTINATRVELRAIGHAQALTAAMQRTMAASSRSPMFQADADGRCEWVNDTWQRATGVTQEEAAGMGWVNGIHTDDRARVLAEWLQAVEDVRTFRCDYRYRHIHTLDEVLVRTEAHPIKTTDGRIAGYVGTAVLLDRAGREAFSSYDRRHAPPLSSAPTRTP